VNDILGFYDELRDGGRKSEGREKAQESSQILDTAALSPSHMQAEESLVSRKASVVEERSRLHQKPRDDIIVDREALNELNRITLEGQTWGNNAKRNEGSIASDDDAPPLEDVEEDSGDALSTSSDCLRNPPSLNKRRHPPISSPTYTRKKKKEKNRVEYATSLAQLLNYLDACHKQFDPTEVARLRERQLREMKEMIQLEKERRSIRDICEYSLENENADKGFPNGRLPLDAVSEDGQPERTTRASQEEGAFHRKSASPSRDSRIPDDSLALAPSLHRFEHQQQEQLKELLLMKFGPLKVQIVDDFASVKFSASRGGVRRMSARTFER